MFRDFKIWEDDLIPIYLTVRGQPFVSAQIAHIIPFQSVTRYSARKYFVPVKDETGRRCRDDQDRPYWRLNNAVIQRCARRLASPDADYRWQNLAEGLTGGAHP